MDDDMKDEEYMGEDIGDVGEDEVANLGSNLPPQKKKFKLPDISKGILGDRTIGKGRLKIKLNQIPLPWVDPNFHKNAKATGCQVSIYLSSIELFHGLIVLVMNFLVYSFYMFVSWGNMRLFPPMIAEYVGWIFAFLWPLIYLIVSTPKFFFFWMVSKEKDSPKRLLTMQIIFIVWSIIVDILFIYLCAGGPGGVGLYQTIEVGIVMIDGTGGHFFRIATFILCLGMACVFIAQVLINASVIVLVVVKIIKKSLGKVKSVQSNPEDLAGISPTDVLDDDVIRDDDEWGGVDFNDDEPNDKL